MNKALLAIILVAVAGTPGAHGADLPAIEAKEVWNAPAEGWNYFFGSCSWYCGAPAIRVEASSFLSEPSGLKHPPRQAHDRKMARVWSEGVPGNGEGESLTFTFSTTLEDTTGLGVTMCAIAAGHQGSNALFRKNARPKTLELRIDGKPTAVLKLRDVMGLQTFPIPKLTLERPSTHTITLKIIEVYPGSKFEDTCIAEVYFRGTGKMH